jgi:O-antigen/teichoic acid export membrane protein
MGRAADVARFTAVGATFNVVLDALLIPLLGAMGSVIGTVLVMSSLNGYALLRARDRLELNGLRRVYCLKAAGSATAMVLTMGVGTLGLRAIPFDIGGWLAIAAGLGVYVGVAWLWGLVSSEDVGALRAAFSRAIA